MPTKAIKIPKFKSEAQEAEWWDANPEVATSIMSRALRAGTARRGPLKTVTMRLPVADVRAAQVPEDVAVELELVSVPVAAQQAALVEQRQHGRERLLDVEEIDDEAGDGKQGPPLPDLHEDAAAPGSRKRTARLVSAGRGPFGVRWCHSHASRLQMAGNRRSSGRR